MPNKIPHSPLDEWSLNKITATAANLDKIFPPTPGFTPFINPAHNLCQTEDDTGKWSESRRTLRSLNQRISRRKTSRLIKLSAFGKRAHSVAFFSLFPRIYELESRQRMIRILHDPNLGLRTSRVLSAFYAFCEIIALSSSRNILARVTSYRRYRNPSYFSPRKGKRGITRASSEGKVLLWRENFFELWGCRSTEKKV